MPRFFLASAILYMGLSFQTMAEVRVHCNGEEENLATYLDMHRILFNERNASRAGEFYADRVLSHNQDSGGALDRIVTPADMEEMWIQSKKDSPERVLEDELILCVEDFVVVRTTLKGIRQGTIMGKSISGIPYNTTATDIYRFNKGKVVERWGNADLITLFDQLGFKMLPQED